MEKGYGRLGLHRMVLTEHPGFCDLRMGRGSIYGVLDLTVVSRMQARSITFILSPAPSIKFYSDLFQDHLMVLSEL